MTNVLKQQWRIVKKQVISNLPLVETHGRASNNDIRHTNEPKTNFDNTRHLLRRTMLADSGSAYPFGDGN